MASQFLKDIASGALFGTTPGVTRPTVAAPSPFDNQERMDISDRFRPTPDYTNPASYSSAGGGSSDDGGGTSVYSGSLNVTGMSGYVDDNFVGMNKYLGAGISPLGLNPFIAAGSAISKKNLQNIQTSMLGGEKGYGVGMLDGRIVGVSPGPLGGYVLSGVLPEGITAAQRRELINKLLDLNPTTEVAGGKLDPDSEGTATDNVIELIESGVPPEAAAYDYTGFLDDDQPSGNQYGDFDSTTVQEETSAMEDAYQEAAYGSPPDDDNDDGGGSDSGGGGDYGTPDFDIGDYMRQGGRVGMQAGGTASKDPVQSTGFVDGPPQNYAKGTTVADTENHRVRVGSFVLNAPTTERLQKEGKLPKGPQKRKAAKGGKMMEVALSKGEYVIDADDIGKFGGYDALNKENDKGKPEVERRQAAARGGFLGGYSDGGMLRYAGPLSAVELMKSGLDVTTPTSSGFIQQKEYDSGGLPPYTVNDIDIGAVQKALTLVETRGYEDRNEGYFFTRSDKTGKESSAFGPLQITKKTLEAMKSDNFGQLDLAFKTEPGLKKYYEKLIVEGRNAINVKKYEDIYIGPEGSPRKTNASEEEKAKYRGLGYGNIPLEDHKKYYPTVAGLYMRYKAGMSKSEEDLVRRHFGNNSSTKKYYAAKKELGLN